MRANRAFIRSISTPLRGIAVSALFLLSDFAQTAPSITRQPACQTNLAGTSVAFSVGVSGTGPFTYQWLFNGTNLPNGIITAVAGNGSPGYSGDGGAATTAELNAPFGVTVDASGSVEFYQARSLESLFGHVPPLNTTR